MRFSAQEDLRLPAETFVRRKMTILDHSTPRVGDRQADLISALIFNQVPVA
jgi:hypothetical protein